MPRAMEQARAEPEAQEMDDGTASPAGNIGGLEWVLSQPLGLAILILLVFGFATGRIVPGRALQKEQERSDRLAEANKIQAEAITKVLIVAETTQRTAEAIHTLMQGIASNLQSRQRGEP